jgi:L-ascorbate metabolism protein UlaG (beta-lactamase superfamily)
MDNKLIRIFIKLNLLMSGILMTTSLHSQDKPVVDKISTSAGEVDLYFIGHASLVFSLNNYFIYIDPVRSSGSYNNLPKGDLILVTHEHGDHLDTALVSTLRKNGTILICNAMSARNISWARVMKPGDSNHINGITIEAVQAYNIKNVRPDGQPYHPKDNGNGYILTIGDKKFYIAGDTENTPEMKALKNIDVAFLPMNLPYTMTPEMVADAARAFKPKILYPYHYGSTNTNEIINLLKDSGIEVRIRNLK